MLFLMELTIDKQSYKLSKEEFNFYYKNGYLVKNLFFHEEADNYAITYIKKGESFAVGKNAKLTEENFH